jgi:hypothetical protein
MLSLHCRATLVAPYPDKESQIKKIMCKMVRQEKNPSPPAHHWTVVRVDTHRHTRPLTSWPHFAVIDSVEDYCCIASHTLLHNVYVHIVAVKVRFYFVKRLQCCIPFAESLAKAILLGELFVFAAQTKVTSDLNFNNYKTSYRGNFLVFSANFWKFYFYV